MTDPFPLPEDEFVYLRGVLIGVIRAAKSSPVSRATAQLDAAETLFKFGVNATQHGFIRSELLAGIAGDRGYEPTHMVRACRILLEYPVEVTP